MIRWRGLARWNSTGGRLKAKITSHPCRPQRGPNANNVGPTLYMWMTPFFTRVRKHHISHPGRPQRGPNANNVDPQIVVDTMAKYHTRAWKQHHNPGQQQWLTQQNTGRTLSTESNMYKPNKQPHRRGGHKITTPEGVQCRSHSKQGGSKPAIDHRTCMRKGKNNTIKAWQKQGPPRHQGCYNLSTNNTQGHA